MATECKGLLVFIRRADPARDTMAHGRVTKNHQLYVHAWATGSQELLFDGHDAARRFAEKEQLDIRPPREV